MEKLLTKYFWTLNLLTLGLVAYLVSDGTGELVAASISDAFPVVGSKTGPRNQRPRRTRPHRTWEAPSGQEILDRNFFDSTYDPVPIASLDPLEGDIPATVSGEMPIVPCSGGSVKLLATVASRYEPTWSFAAVNEGSEQKMCRVGDSLDNRTVSGITWRYLFLRGSTDECYIDLYGEQDVKSAKPRKLSVAGKSDDIGDGIQSISETEKMVSRSVVDSLMSNPSQFIKSVRVRPHKEKGKVVGFKLHRFRSNSPLAKLGAKRGDIIRSVNGIPLNSMDQALGAYQSLSSAGNLSFSITRKGKPMDISVTIR